MKAEADFDWKSAFFIVNFLDKTPDKMLSRTQIIYGISDICGDLLLDKIEDI